MHLLYFEFLGGGPVKKHPVSYHIIWKHLKHGTLLSHSKALTDKAKTRFYTLYYLASSENTDLYNPIQQRLRQTMWRHRFTLLDSKAGKHNENKNLCFSIHIHWLIKQSENTDSHVLSYCVTVPDRLVLT